MSLNHCPGVYIGKNAFPNLLTSCVVKGVMPYFGSVLLGPEENQLEFWLKFSQQAHACYLTNRFTGLE